MGFAFFDSVCSGNNIINFYESINTVFPLHLHPHIELISIVKGNAVININNKEYNMESGNCAIVLPSHPHSYLKSNDCLVNIIVFSPNLINSFTELVTNKTFESPILTDVQTANEINECIKKLKTCYSNERDICLIKGYLYTIIGHMLRELKLISYDTTNLDTITKVLIKIQGSYTSDISLLDIANDLGFSYCYMSHIFKTNTGYSFTSYVNNLRVNYAKEYIRNTDLPITHIALDCGFDTLRNFNRAFKKITGLTPSEYKNHKENTPYP